MWLRPNLCSRIAYSLRRETSEHTALKYPLRSAHNSCYLESGGLWERLSLLWGGGVQVREGFLEEVCSALSSEGLCFW